MCYLQKSCISFASLLFSSFLSLSPSRFCWLSERRRRWRMQLWSRRKTSNATASSSAAGRRLRHPASSTVAASAAGANGISAAKAAFKHQWLNFSGNAHGALLLTCGISSLGRLCAAKCAVVVDGRHQQEKPASQPASQLVGSVAKLTLAQCRRRRRRRLAQKCMPLLAILRSASLIPAALARRRTCCV